MTIGKELCLREKRWCFRELPLSNFIRATGVGANHSAERSLQISRGIAQIPCQWHPLTVLNPNFCTTTYQRSISLICTTTIITSHCLDGLTAFSLITASPTHPETTSCTSNILPRDVEKKIHQHPIQIIRGLGFLPWGSAEAIRNIPRELLAS